MGGRGSKGGFGVNTISTQNLDEAIEWYVSGDGMWINDYLRGNPNLGELTDREKDLLKRLDKATGGAVGEQMLYRSVDASAIFGGFDLDDLYTVIAYGDNAFGKGAYAKGKVDAVKSGIQRAIGREITEKGFMSTTMDAAIAEQWGDYTGSSHPIVLNIKTNSRTRGADVSWTDKNASWAQREVLLGRGQTYKIGNVYLKNGVIQVDVSMR